MKVTLYCYRGKSKQSEGEVEQVELTSYVEQYSMEKQTFIELKLGESVTAVKVEELERAIQALK